MSRKELPPNRLPKRGPPRNPLQLFSLGKGKGRLAIRLCSGTFLARTLTVIEHSLKHHCPSFEITVTLERLSSCPPAEIEVNFSCQTQSSAIEMSQGKTL
jgi:hypothetical protein